VYRWHRRTVRRSEGSTTISQKSKRDRDTEPDLIRNQNIFRKISTKNFPRSFVMGSERSEKNSTTTPTAAQRGTVTFSVALYFKCSGRAALKFFFFLSVPCGGQGHSLHEGIGASAKRTPTETSLPMQLGLRSHDP
jgi:hypothetical protein